jgi:hypothetical protein
MKFSWWIALCVTLLPMHAAAADVTNETLLQPLPSGFKQGWATSRDGMDMSEFVIPPETVEKWSRLITTQVFHGKGDTPSSVFIQGWGGRMSAACPGLTHGQLVTGHRNGYTLSFVEANCPKNPATNRPERIYIEVFQGKDALYSVQSAFRYEPSSAEVNDTLAFLQSITVCDTRLPERPCPSLTPLKPNGH